MLKCKNGQLGDCNANFEKCKNGQLGDRATGAWRRGLWGPGAGTLEGDSGQKYTNTQTHKYTNTNTLEGDSGNKYTNTKI